MNLPARNHRRFAHAARSPAVISLVNPVANIEESLTPEVVEQLRANGLWDVIASMKDYEAARRAKSTRTSYAGCFETFEKWCANLGTPSLPAAPALVAVYAVYLADNGGHGVTADGTKAGRRPGTVGNHLNAIRAVHLDNGYGDPTAHPDVRGVFAGIKRRKGTRAKPRESMTYDLLTRIVYVIDLRHELRAARDRVLLAAADTAVAGQWRSAPQRTGSITAAQLSRADWQDVLALDDKALGLRLPSRSNRKGDTVDLTIAARPGDPLCLVAAVRGLLVLAHELATEAAADADGLLGGELAAVLATNWQAATGPAGLAGPLLPSLDKRGLPVAGFPSRQQLEARLGRAARAAGLAVSRTQAPADGVWTHEDRVAALAAVDTRRLADVRDRALLLMGWHLASRRSNLTWLRVGEIKDAAGGLDVIFRRSKTDQEQHGRELIVPAQENRFCPVEAWAAWLAAMREACGVAIGPDFPAFPPITKDGTGISQPREVFETRPDGTQVLDSNGRAISLGLEGLCGDEINHLVKARAADAGLAFDVHGRAVPWGSHSLRRGWLTEGARQGIGLADLMAHSGHLSHESVLCYIQAANRWSTANSAPLKMRYSIKSGLQHQADIPHA